MFCDVYFICEIECYLRGREKGEIPQLIYDVALKNGMQKHQLVFAKDSLDGAKKALDWAQPQDLLLLLTLDKREEIFELLDSHLKN